MSKVKYRIREHTPSEGMSGTHSVYAEVVPSGDITSAQLAREIAERTTYTPYEVRAILAALGDIIQEETLKGNRVLIQNIDADKIFTVYPRVQGSISDAQILAKTTAEHELDPSVEVRSVATPDDLKPDQLEWSLGVTMGQKYSRYFAQNKESQRVKTSTTPVDEPASDEPEEPQGGGDNGGGGEVSNEG